MPDNKSKDSRRKVLKSIAAGSGAFVAGKSLPDSWSRPVVDSVILPAHAQTSPASPGCSTEFAGTYDGTATATVERCGDVIDPITPPLTVVIGADCSVSVSYTGNRAYTGTGTIVGDAFSVAISRTEDCTAPAGQNAGTGTVTGTVTGTQISGTAVFGGPCICGTPILTNYTSDDGTYTINLV